MLDKEFYDNLETKNKKFIEAGKYEKYISELDKSDICLMPLADTEANRCKSDIKYVEASSRGVASIMSKVVYEKTVTNQQNGLIVEENGWYDALNEVIKKVGLAKKIAENSIKYVDENRILKNCIYERVREYKDLFINKDKYTRQLKLRLDDK